MLFVFVFVVWVFVFVVWVLIPLVCAMPFAAATFALTGDVVVVVVEGVVEGVEGVEGVDTAFSSITKFAIFLRGGSTLPGDATPAAAADGDDADAGASTPLSRDVPRFSDVRFATRGMTSGSLGLAAAAAAAAALSLLVSRQLAHTQFPRNEHCSTGIVWPLGREREREGKGERRW